jgi:hypothetical protein
MWVWLGPLLKLMGFVADQIRRLQRRQEQEKRDHEQSEIQDDPVEFGRNHFNRVRDPSDLSADSDEATDASVEKLADEQPGRRKP